MSYVKCACGFLLILFSLTAVVPAQVANPRFVYEEFVSLSILPFEKTDNGSKEMDLRSNMIQALGKSAVMDYLIHSPEGGDLEDLYARAFSRRKDRTYWPIADYWRRTTTQYIIFGNYSTNQSEIIADLFLYDVRNDKMLIHKKFKAPISEQSELVSTMLRAIETSLTELPKNKNRIKTNGTKR
jgi:hypothetical protein